MSKVNFYLVKHVIPLKVITVSHLELVAAVTAVKVNHMIVETLEVSTEKIVFWTGSTIVFKYIRNDKAKFHIFVANHLSSMIVHRWSSGVMLILP